MKSILCSLFCTPTSISYCCGCKKHHGAVNFFELLSVLMNVVCASCNRKYMLIESQKDKVEKAIGSGEIETGSGLNQELSLVRAGDTR